MNLRTFALTAVGLLACGGTSEVTIGPFPATLDGGTGGKAGGAGGTTSEGRTSDTHGGGGATGSGDAGERGGAGGAGYVPAGGGAGDPAGGEAGVGGRSAAGGSAGAGARADGGGAGGSNVRADGGAAGEGAGGAAAGGAGASGDGGGGRADSGAPAPEDGGTPTVRMATCKVAPNLDVSDPAAALCQARGARYFFGSCTIGSTTMPAPQPGVEVKFLGDFPGSPVPAACTVQGTRIDRTGAVVAYDYCCLRS